MALLVFGLDTTTIEALTDIAKLMAIQVGPAEVPKPGCENHPSQQVPG